MDFLNVKTQLVEIPIQTANSTAQQFKFPTQDFLREKFIISIEAYTVTDIPLSPIGNAVITAVNMQNAFLTLYGQNPEAKDGQGIPSSGEGQWMEQIPLITLHRTQNATPDPFVRSLYGMAPRNIVWEKSFVQLAAGQTLGNADPVSFLFLVGYIGNAGDKKS